jgi:hypothetical protein
VSSKKSFWKPRSSMSHDTAAAADDDDDGGGEMLCTQIITFL